MTVDVLMTVYNAGEYLQRALDSVRQQTYEDWTLTVMDDGSTDPLVDRVLSKVRDERVNVMRLQTTVEERQRSCRYATLFNLGASKTSSEYMTYLTSDDWFEPDRLERMVALLDEGHDVVYGSQRMFRDGVQFGTRPASFILTVAFTVVDLNSVMHTRSAFERVRGWPTDSLYWRNADAYFWTRLTEAGFKFYPVEGAPTDCKNYRDDSVDDRCVRGLTPW